MFPRTTDVVVAKGTTWLVNPNSSD